MANNKIIYNNQTLIDLTGDTAVAEDVAAGKIFHLADGTQTIGTASGGKIMVLEVSCNVPSDVGDVEMASEVSGYSDIQDVIDAMPNVLVIWETSNNFFQVFTPIYYSLSSSPVIDFICKTNGTFRLYYSPNSLLWYITKVSPIDQEDAEEWNFEVDDGNGGTTTYIKWVACKDTTV